MSIKLIKLSEHETGSLYSVDDPTNYFRIKFQNIKALFKPDTYNKACYIKWDVENADSDTRRASVCVTRVDIYRDFKRNAGA